MGQQAAMAICRQIAVDYSKLVVTNSWEYNKGKSPYDDLSLEQVTTLDKAVNVAASVSAPYKDLEGGHEAQTNYWVKLGKWVAKPKMVKHFPDFEDADGMMRYGRCFHCASLVAYSLVNNSEFRKLELDFEICKTAGVKHYFVVVGRDPDSEINTMANWGNDAFIVDVWQGNFGGTAGKGRARDDQFDNPAVTDPTGWEYASDATDGDLAVVVRFKSAFADELAHLAG